MPISIFNCRISIQPALCTDLKVEGTMKDRLGNIEMTSYDILLITVIRQFLTGRYEAISGLITTGMLILTGKY